MQFKDKIKKYLPSKKFTIIALIALGVIGLSWTAVAMLAKNKNTSITAILGVSQKADDNSTLQNLIAKDTDGDSVPDWEEALWGTDPNDKTTNEEIADKDWISQRKKELATQSGSNETSTSSTKNLTETEKFSREFFATVVALKQSGNLDQGAISNISNVVGDKMGNTNLSDNYRVTDLKKTYDVTRGGQAKFYSAIAKIYSQYRDRGLGTELNNMDTSTGEANASELLKISQVYLDFSKKVASLSVPNNLTQNTLDILNGAYNTGLAIKNLAKMQDDPLIGLIGLTKYQKWSEQLIRSSEDLETYLVNGNIIN